MKRLEAWRDGGDRVLGAEATLERLADADNLLRKEDQSQNQRLAAMDEQLAALKAHAQSLQPQQWLDVNGMRKMPSRRRRRPPRIRIGGLHNNETLEGIQEIQAFLTSSKRQSRNSRTSLE